MHGGASGSLAVSLVLPHHHTGLGGADSVILADVGHHAGSADCHDHTRLSEHACSDDLEGQGHGPAVHVLRRRGRCRGRTVHRSLQALLTAPVPTIPVPHTPMPAVRGFCEVTKGSDVAAEIETRQLS